MHIPDKQVTLKMGVIVKPIGIATVNYKPDPSVLVCKDRQGRLHYVLRSTIEQLPVTHNRHQVRNY